jgi:uncharacterized protein (DUF488 family)
MKRVVTIGVYGYDEHNFFAALQRAGVDAFCDIRDRRGVRGADYAFANSRRLQLRLAGLGIRYFHFRDLAPSQALRARQDAWDKVRRTAKRRRLELSREFIEGYRRDCLESFRSDRFRERLGSAVQVAALFCVEREPEACHRSLLAERLRRDLRVDLVHLVPG